MTRQADTICAVATPAGRGGVSVIRVSGPDCARLCALLTGTPPATGQIKNSKFKTPAGELIDVGLSLFFNAPRSFTGEDVWELQVHGSPVVCDMLLATLTQAGCRLARPGEFSERAFLNDKLDLAQAEAIADLIASDSDTAARMALRSLQGAFSRLIDELVAQITALRVYVEAAIDFPDEDVDFLGSGEVATRLQTTLDQLDTVLQQARQGSLVREGIHVVLAGAPNAGKSTLLNILSGTDTAIVTDTPGTTRDLLRQDIMLDGLPLHIIDTAGLRHSDDPVEQEGIRRARAAIDAADRILLLVDAATLDTLHEQALWQELRNNRGVAGKLTVVGNKIDLRALPSQHIAYDDVPCIHLSAKTGQGLDLLRQHLKHCAGFAPDTEGGFIARRRHLDALHRAGTALHEAQQQLQVYQAGELVAEELRRAQEALGEITGVVTADALLGEIFGSFCIGK